MHAILPSQTGGTPADVVSQYVLRVVLHKSIATAIVAKTGEAIGGTGLQELLRRHAGIGATTYSRASGRTLLARCRQTLDSLSRRLEMLPVTPRDVLAIELAHALQMSHVEQSLLRMAIYTQDHPDLRTAMELAGSMDCRGVADLFAAALAMDKHQIHDALNRDSLVRKVDFIECMRDTYASEYLRFPDRVERVIRAPGASSQDVLGQFFGTSPAPRLRLSDFSDHTDMAGIMSRYLAKANESGQCGVNILLHGQPGTGKTEFARAMSDSLSLLLFEVPNVDERQDPLTSWQRVTSYIAAQEAIRHRDNVALLFDEIEDVFPGGKEHALGSRHAHHHGPGRAKGWINTVLDSNPKPAFWISNDISLMDPAYLRRFDLVLEMAGPGLAARKHMIADMFKGLPVPPQAMKALACETLLSPGHLEQIARVLRAYEPQSEKEVESALVQLAGQAPAMGGKRFRTLPTRSPLAYRPDCVNADMDLGMLAESLTDNPVARLCLYGPPGTGKTEWAHYLAEQLGKPLHIRRASDLMGMYVGQTEKLIRKAFIDSESVGAILLIDEADSFIRSREQAHHGWEVRLVNEILTGMEEFEGIFIASTNAMDQLDTASARRFDFKVRFDYLTRDQRRLLLQELMTALGTIIDAGSPCVAAVERIDHLTLGDFANVARQMHLSRRVADIDLVVSLLRREVGFRFGAGAAIGFVHSTNQ